MSFKKKYYYVYLLLLLASIPTCVSAWWDLGHMLVAQIAQQSMTENAYKKSSELLELLAEEFPESATFVTAGCWADDIKRKGLPFFTHWHGTSLPYDPELFLSDAKKSQLTTELECYRIDRVIASCIESLKNPESLPWSNAITLRFLIHLVADIHQPLHVVTFYSKHFPEGDGWGHDFKITTNGATWALHKLWDALVDTQAQRFKRPLSQDDTKHIAQVAAALIQKQSSLLISAHNEMCYTGPTQWMYESYNDAINYAYKDLVPGAAVSEQYLEEARACVERRLVFAGKRLAQVLNEIFA